MHALYATPAWAFCFYVFTFLHFFLMGGVDFLLIMMHHTSCSMIHDSWFMIHDAWGMRHEAGGMKNDARCMMHAAWCMTHDAWCMMRCMMLSRLCLEMLSFQHTCACMMLWFFFFQCICHIFTVTPLKSLRRWILSEKSWNLLETSYQNVHMQWSKRHLSQFITPSLLQDYPRFFRKL